MEATYVDPKTGEKTKYEISYSQRLQQNTIEELKKSNKLKLYLLIGLIVLVVVGVLVWTGSGTIGEIIRRGFC